MMPTKNSIGSGLLRGHGAVVYHWNDLHVRGTALSKWLKRRVHRRRGKEGWAHIDLSYYVNARNEIRACLRECICICIYILHRNFVPTCVLIEK